MAHYKRKKTRPFKDLRWHWPGFGGCICEYCWQKLGGKGRRKNKNKRIANEKLKDASIRL